MANHTKLLNLLASYENKSYTLADLDSALHELYKSDEKRMLDSLLVVLNERGILGFDRLFDKIAFEPPFTRQTLQQVLDVHTKQRTITSRINELKAEIVRLESELE